MFLRQGVRIKASSLSTVTKSSSYAGSGCINSTMIDIICTTSLHLFKRNRLVFIKQLRYNSNERYANKFLFLQILAFRFEDELSFRRSQHSTYSEGQFLRNLIQFSAYAT